MIDNFPIMQVKPKKIIGVQFEAVRRNIKIAETTEDGMIYLPCFFVGVVPSSPSVGLFFLFHAHSIFKEFSPCLVPGIWILGLL